MTRAQHMAVMALCALIALGTIGLTLAQWFYWGDGFAAFATFIGGGCAVAFITPSP